MRTISKVKKSVNASLPPEILEEARKTQTQSLGGINRRLLEKIHQNQKRNLVAQQQRICRRG